MGLQALGVTREYPGRSGIHRVLAGIDLQVDAGATGGLPPEFLSKGVRTDARARRLAHFRKARS